VAHDGDRSCCDGNVKWNDTNANKTFDVGEAGAALACSAAKKK
jgi:hypothetical protein